MRKPTSINVIVHYPKDVVGIHRLLKHIAAENTDLFITALRQSGRPKRQKLDVIDAVFDSENQRKSAKKQLRRKTE